jgi:hypothetical protein
MAMRKEQYIPNPTVPQDAVGKDLYLLTELNKIAAWVANAKLTYSDIINPPVIEPGPTPPVVVPPTDPTIPEPTPSDLWYNCESPNAGLYYRYDDGDSEQWVPVSSGGAGPPGKSGSNPDGGVADSIYLPDQNIDGGFA